MRYTIRCTDTFGARKRIVRFSPMATYVFWPPLFRAGAVPQVGLQAVCSSVPVVFRTVVAAHKLGLPWPRGYGHMVPYGALPTASAGDRDNARRRAPTREKVIHGEDKVVLC